MFKNKWLRRAGRLLLSLYGIALIVSDAYPRIRGGTGVSIGLDEVLGGLFCIGFGFGLKAWSSLAWAIRATLIVLAYCAYSIGLVYGWRFVDWVLFAVFMVAGVLGQYAAHRRALGFIHDARGERQRVLYWNRGRAIYEPTTYSERIVAEGTLKAKRRSTLVWSALLGGIPALCAWWMHGTSNSTLAFVAAVIGTPFLVVAAWELLVELAYLWGYQDMRGAKVLDLEPQKPWLVDVGGQKAHGDARLAGASDAARILSRGQ